MNIYTDRQQLVSRAAVSEQSCSQHAGLSGEVKTGNISTEAHRLERQEMSQQSLKSTTLHVDILHAVIVTLSETLPGLPHYRLASLALLSDDKHEQISEATFS